MVQSHYSLRLVNLAFTYASSTPVLLPNKDNSNIVFLPNMVQLFLDHLKHATLSCKEVLESLYLPLGDINSCPSKVTLPCCYSVT